VEIKLSIAIPTYNGAETISETLDSIVSQLEGSVEIVISDNASTDETAEIVHEYQSQYPVIRYFRNDENLGPDANFDLVVRRSRGEYVWLFSDDDRIRPGGIQKVLDVVRTNRNLAALFVNYGVYSIDLEQCYKERVLGIQHDVYCEDADTFLATTNINPIFMSSNIVQRSLWVQANALRYQGTNWIHYCTLLSLLCGHRSYCIAFPYVMLRSGALRWKPREVLLLRYTLALARFLHGLHEIGYHECSVKEALSAMTHNLPFTIFTCKREGLSVTWSMLKEMMKQFGFCPSFWFLDLPLVLLPQWVHQVVWKVYQIPIIKKLYKTSQSWIWHT